MAINFNVSQSEALNGVRFSTAGPMVVPQMSAPEEPVSHHGLHRSPKDAFSFLMLMNATAQPTTDTQWGTATTQIGNYRYISTIQRFGRYVDDRMQFSMLPLDKHGMMGMEAELDYRCCHFSALQLAVVDDLDAEAGISTLSMRIGAELLSRAAVLRDSRLREADSDVRRSIIKGGMCLANARMIASSLGDDCIIKKDEPVTKPRTNNTIAATTMSAFSIDEHGLYRDAEAPLFTVTYIHPEDAGEPRGSPKTRAYIHIVENIPFTGGGLEREHAPFVQDLMVAAAYMRPHMFPYDAIFTPRSE